MATFKRGETGSFGVRGDSDDSRLRVRFGLRVIFWAGSAMPVPLLKNGETVRF
jgi:hypothetical protein